MLAKNLQGAAAAAAPAYIEDVFSTYLYTGTGSSQTITNGIDLSGKGGLVWIKGRSGATGHRFTDTSRGATKSLESNSAAAEVTESTGLTAFGSTGFTIGADADYNTNTATYVSWAFRKQAKFFDVVTYTGNGSNRTISHNLGSVPGCIIVKRTDTIVDWQVYHRSLANTEYMVLNSTSAKVTGTTRWNSTTPTSTEFSLGTHSTVNANGGTYVAYLFAHDAGGFGATGSDNVISCGSFTTDGNADATVSLGYEPQWIVIKRSDGAGGPWITLDVMRGLGADVNANTARLFPNTSDAESLGAILGINQTGFATDTGLLSNATYIYIAIRRGPMKTPTSGTSVFTPITATASTGTSRSIGFVSDLSISSVRTLAGESRVFEDRLRGYVNTNASSQQLSSSSTGGESTQTPFAYAYTNTNRLDGGYANGYSTVWWHFGRAPGFFDVVAYTGTGVARTVPHNLGAVPELMIVKQRGGATAWIIYHQSLGNNSSLSFSVDAINTPATAWNTTSPTLSVFTVGSPTAVNASAATYIAYLFASAPGVSKVGSYTGTGTTKQIDCGFTGGARFVLIKRTDSTGDWYIWDSARGIVSGNDPYLLFNGTAAEVTNTDYIDTYSAGFEISSTAPAAINANGGTFIFLAIA